MQVTQSKTRHPDSIGYNNLIAMRFPTIALAASQGQAAVQGRLPLALNFKIMAVSYVVSGSPAGTCSINIVNGAGSYETAGSAPSGKVTLANTFSIGDTVTITVGGVAATFLINSRDAGNNVYLAGNIAAGINRNLPFGAAYVASSSDSIVTIQNVAYAIAGNSTTFTAVAVSASGTATASASTLLGGTAGTLPVMPALDNSNLTAPAQTAAAGTALFPVDLPINMTADVPSVAYPVNPRNFDAIWPSFSELTVRTITNGAAAGNLDIILWGVPYDVNPTFPQAANTYFLPSRVNL